MCDICRHLDEVIELLYQAGQRRLLLYSTEAMRLRYELCRRANGNSVNFGIDTKVLIDFQLTQ